MEPRARSIAACARVLRARNGHRSFDHVGAAGPRHRRALPRRRHRGVASRRPAVGSERRVVMKTGITIASTVFATTAAIAQSVSFDGDRIGSAPAGWTCGVTGRGSPHWAVAADPSAPSKSNVLMQSGSGTFPWCVKSGTALTDGTVEVKFKPISGKEDQAGGLVWRWKDGDNYYVARANALENNISLYYTTGGRRNTIKYVSAPVARNVWHMLRVDFGGKRIAVTLDGKTYIDLEDEHIAGPGLLTLLVGLHAYRYHYRTLLLGAALLMAGTGLGFAVVTDFWPLLLIALVGTLNPSSGDVSVFLPLEHAVLSRVVDDRRRTAVFARYSLVGSLVAALGSLTAALPAMMADAFSLSARTAIQAMFVLYAFLGVVAACWYRGLPWALCAVAQETTA